MRKVMFLLVIASAALLVACGSAKPDSSGSVTSNGKGGVTSSRGAPAETGMTGKAFPDQFQYPGAVGAMPPFPAPTPAPYPPQVLNKDLAAPAPTGAELPEQPSRLDAMQRQVISIASLSLEVEMVQAAATQVRTIAESLGGFVEQMSSFGDAKNQQATITIRVPQPQFFSALERLEALGKVQSRNLGSEDVSNQFIDLKARLASAQRQEQSLLSLLQKASTVTEILTIERELTRIRSEIERLQGQLNFLERRVELATITVSLFPPQQEVTQPPAATLVVETSDVAGKVDEVKNLVSTLKGKVDRAFISVRDEQERAELSLRVFSADFDQAVSALERLGKVKVKELQQGQTTKDGVKEKPEQPDAYIQLSLLEPVKADKPWLWWAIGGGAAGGVALIAVLIALFIVTYRAGKRRGSIVPAGT
ncbi:MAG: DUF4349 domain-containing protein [SAR202 cluster bacterium]|nr:DUF4349 domain-containing protein [SAR202 cluster bacterium]